VSTDCVGIGEIQAALDMQHGDVLGNLALGVAVVPFCGFTEILFRGPFENAG
jgi:hypothetical protein